MKLYPRSYWTSLVPRAITGEEFVGLPFFDSPPDGVNFYVPDVDVLYIYRNPIQVLNQMVKMATLGTGLSDLDYNYALAGNTRGAYTIRGRGTKCSKTSSLKVLLLVGKNERQTDILKENANAFDLQALAPQAPGPGLKPEDANVHVFDLIEYLLYRGVYEGRNDGVYGPFCQRAVKKLQLELDVPNITGYWDDPTAVAVANENREYIQSGQG